MKQYWSFTVDLGDGTPDFTDGALGYDKQDAKEIVRERHRGTQKPDAEYSITLWDGELVA